MTKSFKNFEVTDPDTLAMSVAERWKDQYYKGNGEWRSILFGTGRSEDIYKALVALGQEPDPGDIEEIIGNPSWTHTKCDGCGVENAPVIVLDNSYSDDNAEVCLCYGCSTEASMKLWRTYYE